MLRRLFSLFVLCALSGLVSPVRAHDPALSGIRVLYRDSDVVVNVTTHISRLLPAAGPGKTSHSPDEMDREIRRRLHLRFDGKNLNPPEANVIGDNANDIVSWQVVLTEPVKEVEVLSPLYPEDPASQTVVTLIRDGQVFQEVMLDAQQSSLLRNEPSPTPLAVAVPFLREGITHIFGGTDHVAFVVSLLLLGGTLKTLLRTVTAFTLAHSITLTLAATGIWNPSPRIIEPLIALSIVALALENLRCLQQKNAEESPLSGSKTGDLRPYYAFGFGLIHGFGFAGALAEVGLPQSSLGMALAAFNIGVELGQVAIILIVAPVLVWLAARRPMHFQRIVLAASVLIGSTGAYWFITRL